MKSKKYKFENVSRIQLINRARIHIICELMSRVTSKFFTDRLPIWQGDHLAGSFYFDNGSGDSFAMVWNSDDLGAAFFDHECSRSHYSGDHCANTKGLLPEDDSGYFFDHLSDEDLQWISRAHDIQRAHPGDPNVTAALICNGNSCWSPDPLKKAKDFGLWMVENYINDLSMAIIDPKAKIPSPTKDFYFSAVVGDIQGPVDSRAWRFQYNLSPEQCDLLLDVSHELENKWNVELSPKQWKNFKTVSENIIDPSSGKRKLGVKENYPLIREHLKLLGISVKS